MCKESVAVIKKNVNEKKGMEDSQKYVIIINEKSTVYNKERVGMVMLEGFSLEKIHLMPGLFQERADVNRNYLMELSAANLLQNFYLEAVVRIGDDAEPTEFHWGWEAPSCQLRGHFLGHWLSAAAVLSVTQKDTELKAKMDKIVDELDRCQELNGGKWCASIPEKYFEKLARDEYVWSPQYTVHKTLLGLMHVYQYTGNKKALKILDGMADWFAGWIADMQQRNPHAVYSGEEGGMLEVWATISADRTGQILKSGECLCTAFFVSKIVGWSGCLDQLSPECKYSLCPRSCKNV